MTARRMRRSTPAALAAALLCTGAATADEEIGMSEATEAGAAAPIAERRDQVIEQHGETRVDPYAWLRDAEWQQVLREPETLDDDIRAHLEAELAYYTASTAHLEPLRDALFSEMRGRIKEDDSSVPEPDGDFAYFVRFRDGGQYPVFARQPRAGGEETILYDGDAEAGDSAFFSIGSVRHSPDHALIAYAVDRVGSEYYDIRVRNITTGEEHAEAIPSTSGYAVWAADSASFFYIERDDNQRPKRVKRHVLGTDPSEDAVIYEEPDDGMFLSVSDTQSGAYILISSGNSEVSEVRYIPADQAGAEPVTIAPRMDNQLYDVDHRGDHFYIQTNADDAVDFKIMRAPVADPSRANWEDWLPHEAGRYVEDFVTLKDFLVRLERRDALPRIVISSYEGEAHEIAIDAGAYTLDIDAGYEFDTTTIRYGFASPAQPSQQFDYDMVTRERTLLKTQEVPSGHDPSLYVVERINAPAEDGAQVPVTILRLKSTPVDGSAPVLLYGYGSYGYFLPDSFSTSILSLVDRGVIFAEAKLRGGSARGRQWYLDGKFEKKMNTFTDFIAAGEALIDGGYTEKGRIVSYGGSAGGLLVGAAVNLRPDLFGGVLAAVPFVDVLSTISDETLPLTPPEWLEWGDPIRDAEAYGWIKAYSPYDNIAADTPYPPVFATGGLTDYRVTYWEPAKWIARLRGEAQGGPFIMRMNMDAGHAGSAARFERLEERAHIYAYALELMGLVEAEPVAHITAEPAE